MPQVLRVLIVTVLLASVLPGSRQLLANQAQDAREQILTAKGKTDVGACPEAIRILDEVVRHVNNSALPKAEKQPLLIDAYLNRGIANVCVQDLEGAKKDFKQLFGLNPTQTLPASTPPTAPFRKLTAAFDEARLGVVGTLKLNVTPLDADVLLGGERVADPGAPIPLAAGTYKIAASRKSFGPVEQEVQIVPGDTVVREIILDRISSTINIVTAPAGVEVLLGETPRGVTSPGPAPAEYSAGLAKLGLRPTDTSSQLEITEVPSGTYDLKLRKSCYVERTFNIDAKQLKDYSYDPFVMDRAVGTIHLSGNPGVVFVDDVPKGTVTELKDVCEGNRKVEVRSPVGRFVQTVSVKRGGDEALVANVRPALAFLAMTGETYYGPDARDRLAQAFASSKLTVFQPAAEQVTVALKTALVSNGWLSTPATGFTAKARHDVSQNVTEALAVQGVAEVHVPSAATYSNVIVRFVAKGSSKADTLEFALDDTRAIQDLIRRLDTMPLLFQNSVGLEVADVFDPTGVAAVVVVKVEPSSVGAQGVAPGDVIAKVNGQEIKPASAFLKVLAAAKDGDTLRVEVRDRGGSSIAPKELNLKVTARPAVIAEDDQTLIANRLIMEYRKLLAAPGSPLQESVLHLNLGVALMKVESWDDAVAELKLAKLKAAPGVSDGTVQYLLARCYRKLGLISEESAALDLAERAEGAQLVVNGPLVGELVKRDREASRGVVR